MRPRLVTAMELQIGRATAGRQRGQSSLKAISAVTDLQSPPEQTTEIVTSIKSSFY